MSLKLWLPLRGDLHNQGLYNLPNPSISSLTWDDAGKLGQCVNNTAIWHLTDDIIGNVWSVALWLNNRAGTWASSNNIIFCKNNSSSSDTHIYFSILGGTSLAVGINGASSTLSYAYTFVADTWYHLAATYDGTNLSLYINGEQVKTGVSTREYTSGRNNIGLHCRSSAAAGTSRTGQVTAYYSNDLRLYDHCLSKAEVKEISQALVLHYKLDEMCAGGTNLIKNGNFQYEMEGWTGGAINTDVPESHPELFKSVNGNSTTTYFIPIEPNHTYKVEHWLKKNGSTATSTYPSIFPYDVDFNFIYYYQTTIGFSTATLTTLSQALNPGDTVIHATDLSNWMTTANNYNYAAIFGYADSTGYVYPDLVYTRTTPAFHSGSSTPKTEIDKTNNTITLLAAYSGRVVPAGTSICQSSAGSTNYYPFGAVSVSSITDWTYKSATFHPAINTRLNSAKYIKYNTYGNSILHTGMKITDLTYGDVVTDSSGYHNNGTSIELTSSTDSARYDSCLSFNGTDSGVVISDLDIANILNTNATISFWIKPSGENGARSCYFSAYSQTSWSLEKTTGNKLRSWWQGSPDTTTSLSITDGEWQHIVVTKSGTNSIKLYLNGELVQEITTTHANLNFGTTWRIGRDTRTGATCYCGLMSDFRLYATALSEGDVAELYHTPLSIDNSMKMHMFELSESSSFIKVSKNGVVFTDEFKQDLKASFYKSNSIEATDFIEK